MENYQVFISYRRDGGDVLAGRIADRLTSMGYCVFFDVETMRSGMFNTQIYTAIDKCEDVILILPPNALERCANSEDWVRKEIVYALNKKKNIIPVMMRGFEFPDTIPVEIEAIRFMEGVAASSDYFDATVNRLVSLLRSKVGHKKIVDEILYLTKQNSWSYSVQTSASGTVLINYITTGLKNVPKVNSSVIVFDENNITILSRKIIEFKECDKPKVFELLHNINKMSLFVMFEIAEQSGEMYIQARYDVYHAISNKAGVCLNMIEEMAREIDRFYPKMIQVICQGK